MTWINTLIAGLIGLFGAIILTLICIIVMAADLVPVLLSQTVVVWGLFAFLLLLSLAEIPVMIFGIRRISRSPNPNARYVALATTAGYPLFGGVYAAPFILLTGQLVAGALLAALSFVRFASAVIFLSRSD